MDLQPSGSCATSAARSTARLYVDGQRQILQLALQELASLSEAWAQQWPEEAAVKEDEEDDDDDDDEGEDYDDDDCDGEGEAEGEEGNEEEER